MRDISVSVIEDSVPIPVRVEEAIPIRELKVGQSVAFDLDKRSYVQSVASRLKRTRGMEYTVRKTSPSQCRIWRVK